MNLLGLQRRHQYGVPSKGRPKEILKPMCRKSFLMLFA